MNDAVIEKVRNLLILADPSRGATEAEAINAAQKAQELCVKHGIRMASISLDENENSSVEVGDEFLSLQAGAWRRSLANAVAKSFGGRGVWIPNYGTHTGNLHIFAQEDSISPIVQTYRSLENWVDVESVIATENRVDKYVHGKTYRTSWIEGCVGRINYRLNEKAQMLKDDAKSEGHSTALVRIDADVDSAVGKKYESLRTTKRQRSVGDYGAYVKGQAAGNDANIGNKSVGKEKQQITA